MRLIDNWRAELNRLWSVHAAIFGALLASGDQIIAAIYGAGMLSPLAYAVILVIVIVLRMVQQNAPATPAA